MFEIAAKKLDANVKEKFQENHFLEFVNFHKFTRVCFDQVHKFWQNNKIYMIVQRTVQFKPKKKIEPSLDFFLTR